MASVELAGIACCVPERILTNSDLEKLVETSDEWIIKRTGISTRHVITKETTVELGYKAACMAIEQAGIDKNEIGLIVLSTVTGEYLTPSIASLIQKELDIDCPCMDVSAGCTGYIYGLVTGASLMDTLNLNAVLVIASEALSYYTDWTDRATCVLFGDGAGAVVLKKSAQSCMHYPILGGIPDREDVLYIKKELRATPFRCISQNPMQYLRMKGSEVFAFATNAVEETLRKLLKMCKDKPYTKIIPHQANEKIIDYVRRKMNLKKSQFFLNISQYANTSSATIPIALCDAYNKGWLKKGDRVALVGFGAGLTYGGVVIDWTI